jgi:hypothetical protein
LCCFDGDVGCVDLMMMVILVVLFFDSVSMSVVEGGRMGGGAELVGWLTWVRVRRSDVDRSVR